MSHPNFDQLQTDQQNQQDSGQQGSNPPQQQSNTNQGGYDPRVDTLVNTISELQRVNAAILEKLNAPPIPPTPPTPTYTEDQFRENPAGIIDQIVERRVGSVVDKLKNDVNAQLAPINNFIGQSRREKFADDIIDQIRGNPSFNQLSNPNVVAALRQSIINYTGELTLPALSNLYIFAAGAVATGSFNSQIPPSNNGGNQQNPPPSAHIRPDPRPTDTRNTTRLPALDENQNRIMKQRGWTHARAAYMFKLISETDYKKVEPDGKLIEGL